MKYLLALTLYFAPLLLHAQSDAPGIRFFKGPWRKALAEAKATGKLIFVDVYTDWCVPCKKMEQEIFPLPEVGEKFNAHFINLQLDAEGNGSAVASRYEVRSYPTYLWIDADGNVVYRAKGYNSNPRFFLAHADAALKAGGQMPADLTKLYEGKKTDKAFLRPYIARMQELGQYAEVTAALDQYLTLLSPEELQQPQQGNFLLKHVNDISSHTFSYILGHQAFFAGPAVLTDDIAPGIVRRSPEAKLGEVLSSLVSETMLETLGRKNDTLFNKLMEQGARIQHTSVIFPLVVNAFRLHYWHLSKNTAQYVAEGVPYLDSLLHLPADTVARLDELRFQEVYDGNDENNRHACSAQIAMMLISNSRFYGNMSPAGTPAFEKALAWAEKGVEYGRNNPAYHEQLCNLYIKAGRNGDAKKAIRSAIDLAAGREEVLNTYKIKLESIP